MSKFTIGCDPEVFVAHKGKVVSAHGMIAGSKKEPLKVNNGAVQVDGMALEINTDPVPLVDNWGNANEAAFASKVRNVLQELKLRIPEGHTLQIKPAHKFGHEYIEQQPEEAKELGCDPDFNAYTGEANPAPDGGADFRTAAGHIHVGWGADIPVNHPDHFEICRMFIKNLDFTAGFLSVLIDPDPVRRELYGKAGAFRPKSYGVEYRTPSNVWIKNNDLRGRMFRATAHAVSITKKQLSQANYGLTEENAQKWINTSDVEAIKKFVTAHSKGTYVFGSIFAGLI